MMSQTNYGWIMVRTFLRESSVRFVNLEVILDLPIKFCIISASLLISVFILDI